MSAAVSEHTVPKNYLKYKNKTGKEALPFITEFLETTDCLGDRAPEESLVQKFTSKLQVAKWKIGWLEVIQRKHLNRSNLVYTSNCGEGMLDLHKEAMQHANRKGRVSVPGQVI